MKKIFILFIILLFMFSCTKINRLPLVKTNVIFEIDLSDLRFENENINYVKIKLYNSFNNYEKDLNYLNNKATGNYNNIEVGTYNLILKAYYKNNNEKKLLAIGYRKNIFIADNKTNVINTLDTLKTIYFDKDSIIDLTIGEPDTLDPHQAYDTASGEVIYKD
ncbi:hypothetical protein [Marinitoga sp. 1155]|uniref:hypothetical protein n=2 Tax=unclassified Marinitoga TaxID=2640159 RepID=UPI000B29C23C|nr:hypothetical protein [Marinitoga sp. 1155]